MLNRRRSAVITVAAQITLSDDCLLVVASRTDSHLNWKRGDGAKEGSPSPSRKGDPTKGAPGWDTQGIKHQTQTPFLNPNPFNQWYRIKNMARVRVNGRDAWLSWTMAPKSTPLCQGLLKIHSLDVRPLSDLVGRWVVCIGLGNAPSLDLLAMSSYGVQVDRIQAYDEDQIALVIPDLSNFHGSGPSDPGNCHDRQHVMNAIKEK